MKVVAHTRSKLEMKHFPINSWFAGALLIGTFLFLLIYLVCFNPVSATLNCNRQSDGGINCKLTRFYMINKPQIQKIFDPQEANVETITGSKGGKSYKVIITTNFRNFELLPGTLNYDKNQEIATKINSFLTSGQISLFVSQSQWHEYSFYLIIPVIFLIMGLVLASYPITHCTFYKSMNRVIIEYKGLFGSQINEYPLIDINRVDLEEKNTRSDKVYRPILVVRSHGIIPIHKDYTNKKNSSHIIAAISSFLASESY